ncbi:HupE/UreJ family protein [Hyunsoonleella flava]|uniref:HupE/UreJ family protein n=1 Tax=Hyunsoonleella flava TaxID=2527939 RepID=A0A4Q9FJR0_9FLAO|nr:HupE/UreJ family protein [Hyunsoonleella flava]TBN04426.1 HupE/UreJ family protein [Hyunsoonleella flava]
MMKCDFNKKTSFFIALFLFLPLIVLSHIPNQSYIFLRIYETNGIHGRFEINTREINKIFGSSFDDSATLEDIQPYIEDIQAYLLSHSNFSSETGNHKVIFGEVGMFEFNLGDFVQLHFQLENTEKVPDELQVTYDAVFEKDNTHRGYLITEYNWRAGVINEERNITLDFAPGSATDTMDLNKYSVWNGFYAMIKQGVWHIWIGLDHILFLLALILPSVVRRKSSSIFGWEPVMTFKSAFLYIIKVVTFFTIAHTITLTLASLEIVMLPSRLVESIIAFSIGLAAYHNIKPIFKMRDWIIAFIFGLFHGFGFASVLSDLGLTGEFLTLSLLGFNVGVEIGQLVIIAAIFPILYFIRKRNFYPKLLVFLSGLLIIISLYWCIERVFDINLPLDEQIFQLLYKVAKATGLK